MVGETNPTTVVKKGVLQSNMLKNMFACLDIMFTKFGDNWVNSTGKVHHIHFSQNTQFVFLSMLRAPTCPGTLNK